MITEKMKRFIEKINQAFVASSDISGHPHLAAVKGLQVPDPRHVVFTAWCCPRTLENLAGNPSIAVAVMDPATGAGYQFIGHVEKTSDIGILDGYDPRAELPEMPQVQYQLVVSVREAMEFTHGVHTDRPLTVSLQ